MCIYMFFFFCNSGLMHMNIYKQTKDTLKYKVKVSFLNRFTGLYSRDGEEKHPNKTTTIDTGWYINLVFV